MKNIFLMVNLQLQPRLEIVFPLLTEQFSVSPYLNINIMEKCSGN